MSIPDSEALLEEASETARDASNILKRFKDEPEGVYIPTLSGPLPSLKEWLKLRKDEFDVRYEEIQELVDEYGTRFNAIHETDGTLKNQVVDEDNLVATLKAKIDKLTKITTSTGNDNGAGAISFSDTIAYVSGTVGAYMLATKNRIDNLATLVDNNEGNIQDTIDAINDQITGIDQSIDDLEASVSSILSRLSALESFQTDATTRLTSLESFRTSTQTALTNLTNDYNASIAKRTFQRSIDIEFGSLAGNSETSATFTLNGVTPANCNAMVNASPSVGIIFDCYIPANNTVAIRCINRTAAAIVVSVRTFYVTAFKFPA